MNITIVQGTRPEIIKNYSVVKALSRMGVPTTVLHTNQHYMPSMRDEIYANMEYEPTDVMHGEYRIGKAVDWIQKRLISNRTTHVLVNGDTAASIAGAIAAMYLDIDVSHIEAGLRSGDPIMLEERNRVMVDSMAALLFAYTEYERRVLSDSVDTRGTVFVEGNTTVDMLLDFRSKIVKPSIRGKYAYVTLHRRELTGSRERLQLVLQALGRISRELCRVVFSIHPRTLDAISCYGLGAELIGMDVREPQSVFDCLSMQAHAAVVLTDSGCIQEEAYMLKTPCVTIRENTERHLTVKYAANRLSGFDEGRIVELCAAAIENPTRFWPDIYGEYGVGDRIVGKVLTHMDKRAHPVRKGSQLTGIRQVYA